MWCAFTIREIDVKFMSDKIIPQNWEDLVITVLEAGPQLEWKT